VRSKAVHGKVVLLQRDRYLAGQGRVATDLAAQTDGSVCDRTDAVVNVPLEGGSEADDTEYAEQDGETKKRASNSRAQ